MRVYDQSRQGRAESRRMTSDSVRASAHDGFRVAGRGVAVVMTFDDQDEVRFSTIEDLRRALVEAPELEGLIGVAGEAVASYDREREAVVMESSYDGVSVHLVRAADIVTLGTLAFVPPI